VLTQRLEEVKKDNVSLLKRAENAEARARSAEGRAREALATAAVVVDGSLFICCIYAYVYMYMYICIYIHRSLVIFVYM